MNVSTMLNNKSFCIAPWVQTVIRTNGYMNPCCSMISDKFNLKETSIAEYYKSEDIEKLKHNMLQGTSNPECNVCYQNEQKYGTSMRTEFNADYKIISDKYLNKTLEYFKYDQLEIPDRIELHVGNVCNLKCLTCHPRDSSALLSEDKILKLSNYNQKDFTLDDTIVDKVVEEIRNYDIKILDLRGGESLLAPGIKRVLKELDKTVTNNIKLRVQTNGTMFDDIWTEIFAKFKEVEIMLSIDAYGDDNHYIRFPADWSDIETNLVNFRNCTNNVFVNITVSNINLPVLPKLFDWLIKNNISCKISVLESPEYLHLTNMPAILLEKYLIEIKKYQNQFKFKHSNNDLSGIIDYIEKKLSVDDCNNRWIEFCNIISLRDSYRKNSIFSVVPDFKEYWNA